MSTGRYLKELLVVDLRKELARRGLDSTGTKQILVERLRKAIIDDNEDPDKWRCDMGGSCSDELINNAQTEEQPPAESNEEEVSTEKPVDILYNEVSSTTSQANEKNENPVEETDTENDDGKTATKSDVVLDSKKNDDLKMLEVEENCKVKAVIPAVDNSATTKETADSPHQHVDQEDCKNEAKNCSRGSSPAIDCSLVVGTDGGTSELDREISSFSESPKSYDQLKSQEQKATNPIDNNKPSNETKHDDTNECKDQAIWINNIASVTKAIALKNLFSKHGKVLVARIVRKSYPGGSKLCGYIRMSSVQEADKAICAVHKTTLDENLIFCVRGDNKRTEDILSEHQTKASSKPPLASSVVAKAAPASAHSNPVKKVSPRTNRVSTAGDPSRKGRIDSSRDFRDAIDRKSRAAERRLRRASILEQDNARKESELKRREVRVSELERQYEARVKELDVEREVLRDAKTRFARDQNSLEVKEADLRSYEIRLMKLEADIRVSQEHQRQYEAERIRQQKMAAVYDEEMQKRRHELTQHHQQQRRPTDRATERSISPQANRSSVHWSSATNSGGRSVPGRYWQNPPSSGPRSATGNRGWQGANEVSAHRSTVSKDTGVSHQMSGQTAYASSTPTGGGTSGLTSANRPSGRPILASSNRRIAYADGESAAPPMKIKKSFDYRSAGRYEGSTGTAGGVPNPAIVSLPTSMMGVNSSSSRLAAASSSRPEHQQVAIQGNQEYQPNWRQGGGSSVSHYGSSPSGGGRGRSRY